MQSFIRTSSNNCSSEASDTLGGFSNHCAAAYSAGDEHMHGTHGGCVQGGEFPSWFMCMRASVCVNLEFHAENRYMERLLREVLFHGHATHMSRILRTRTHGRHHTQITQARFSHTDHASRITHHASRTTHHAHMET